MKPERVLLVIVCVMAVLGALCIVLPGQLSIVGKEVRWPTLAEVFEKKHPDISIQPSDTIPETPEEPEEPEQPDTVVLEKPKPVVIPKVEVNDSIDSRYFLRAFYEALPQASERVVRVVHYGDSQIEEDRMSQQIREQLQSRFGGQGVGLMPLAQTIPTVTMKQELYMNGRRVNPNAGPRRYMVYGIRDMQRRDSHYGVMGQMAVMADSLVRDSEAVQAVCVPQSEKVHYSRWRVFADSTIHYDFSGDTAYLWGRGAVYGLSQESANGVIVDNIPMRGCMGLVFTKIDAMQLSTFYREENVKLIIMQFGGNAIPSNEKPTTISAIVYGLRDQIRYIKRCAPNASILFIGPSDMIRMTDGEWETYPLVPYMDRLLKKITMEEGVAYFSLFQWMGGSGSMIRWRELGLAGEDGVHFHRSGARKAGNAVAEWMLEGMENGQWKIEN